MFDAADATHKAQHFVRGDRHDNPACHFRFSAGWSVATNTERRSKRAMVKDPNLRQQNSHMDR
jgi:hypothetical protein